MNNLHELSSNPSPYILLVIPCPLPIEIVEGEHYVIADLLSLALGSLSPAKNLETETVGGELVISTQSRHPSLANEDSDPIPEASKDDKGSRLEHLPFMKRVPVLPPNHLRRESKHPNG